MPPEWTVSLGEATEQLREKHGITRERQDEFAARSHRLAEQAWAEGFYDDLVVAVPGVDLARDESIRPGHDGRGARGAQDLVPHGGGTVTAGNASPLNDGASAVLLGSERARRARSRPDRPVAGRGGSALEPQFFGYAPVEAANRAVGPGRASWDDVAAVELNEAFAAQSLACLDAWPIDPEIVNRHGGAIAIGHPLGASGGRILGTLARSLQRSGERWGVAASASASVRDSRSSLRTSAPLSTAAWQRAQRHTEQA